MHGACVRSWEADHAWSIGQVLGGGACVEHVLGPGCHTTCLCDKQDTPVRPVPVGFDSTFTYYSKPSNSLAHLIFVVTLQVDAVIKCLQTRNWRQRETRGTGKLRVVHLIFSGAERILSRDQFCFILKESPQLTMEMNPQRSAFVCLPGAWIQSMHHHAQLFLSFPVYI